MYMGIDLSLTSTGLCFINSSGNHTSLIKTDLKGCRRLAHITNEVMMFVGLHNPDIIAIEGYSFGSKSCQAFSMGELGGLVKIAIFRQDKILIIPPKTLKKFITGNGNSGKDIMLLKTYRKYGIEFSDNNICDAFGLACMAKSYVNGADKNYEKEALAKVSLLE